MVGHIKSGGHTGCGHGPPPEDEVLDPPELEEELEEELDEELEEDELLVPHIQYWML